MTDSRKPGFVPVYSLFLLLIFFLSCRKTPSDPVYGNIDAKWRLVSSQPNIFIRSLCFTDSITGYAAGSFINEAGYFLHGVLLKTTNGGLSWLNITTDTMPDLSSVVFTNPSTGYLVSHSQILKTIDAGAHWFPVFKGENYFLQTAYFFDSDVGFVTGIAGTVLKTTDSGLNWNVLNSGTSAQLHSVFFTDSQTGYIAGYQNQTGNSYGFILKTNNGGATWDSVSTSNFLPESIVFTDANTGFAACATAILKTTDGGERWINVNNSGIDGFIAVAFPNSATGFAVGQNGNIVKTSDGGIHWTALPVIDQNLLTSVFFVNERIGYTAGFNVKSWSGEILKWK